MEQHSFGQDFWEHSGVKGDRGIEPQPVTQETIRQVQDALQYRLPESYIRLMQVQNGGIPQKSYVGGMITRVEYIYGIAMEGHYSLVEEYKFWVVAEDGEEKDGQYPPIGIPICETWTGGHDMIFLDYRECGREGEPKVALVDEEGGYEITEIADSFDSFLSLLTTESDAKEKCRLEEEQEQKRRKDAVQIVARTPKLDQYVLTMYKMHHTKIVVIAVIIVVTLSVIVGCVLNLASIPVLLLVALTAVPFLGMAVSDLKNYLDFRAGKYSLAKDRIQGIIEADGKRTGNCLLYSNRMAWMWEKADKPLNKGDEVLVIRHKERLFVAPWDEKAAQE